MCNICAEVAIRNDFELRIAKKYGLEDTTEAYYRLSTVEKVRRKVA